MTAIALSVATFRMLFPAYSNSTTYSNATIQVNFDTAIIYISDENGGCCCAYQGMTVAQQTRALYLMAAHLLYIQTLIAAGQTPGLVQGATVDKVSVTLTPPPNANQWQWWLGTSPYGQQLLALLQAASAGGFYFGGRAELGAFRRPYRAC